jgi:hypothetical protein
MLINPAKRQIVEHAFRVALIPGISSSETTRLSFHLYLYI